VSTSLIITIIVVVVVVIALIAIVYFLLRRRRQQQQERQEEARREFGPEYDRLAEERGSERKAEKELRERREKVEEETRPLSDESRERYTERWQNVEKTFVDDPVRALDDADGVVEDILKERNFPSESRDEASRDVGVTHPGIVEEFRQARRVHEKATGRGDGETDLEHMRRAIQKYRSVYERLTER
jgi:hypothetical protein